MGNLVAACKAFWQVLRGAELVTKLEVDRLRQQLQQAKAAPAAPPPKTDDRFQEGAVYALLLLQREGRLIDFLQEQLDGFEDEQIGAAVRQIHKDCRRVLAESFDVQPVLTAAEGDPIAVPEPVDATTVKLTGNVPERPPFKGTLRHQGWRAAHLRLPERTGKIDATIIQPAEIEL
jgi:hypothetical protein